MEEVFIKQNNQPKYDVSGMTFADLLAQVNQLEQQKPIQERLSEDILKSHILNGINDGNGLVDAWQTANNIRRPQTMEEQELARAGQFNVGENAPQITGDAPLEVGTSYKKSFLDNLSQGFQDNYTNPIAVRNFAPDDTKTWSNRLGEGLGTIARIMDSPLGRGLLAGGLSYALGGNPTTVWREGLTGAVGRQNSVTADKLYRNQLLANGLSAEELAKIPGNIDETMFRQILVGKQLQDNAEWRKANIEAQQKQNDIMNQLRQDQFVFEQIKAQNDAQDKKAQRDLQRMGINAQIRGQDFTYAGTMAKINADKEKAILEATLGIPLSDAQVDKIIEIDNSLAELDNIINKYSNPNKNNLFGVKGYVRRNPVTSQFDYGASELRQDIELLRKSIAKAKEGGRLTDQDQKFYEKALLNPNLTREQFINLASKYKTQTLNRKGIMLDNYSKQGKNINNFSSTTGNKPKRIY